MANIAANVRRVAHGLSDFNHRFFQASNGSVPNGDTLTVDLSAETLEAPGTGTSAPQPMVPYSVEITSLGAGAVGARLHTKAPATVTWTFDEATGLLVITNGSGGALILCVKVILCPLNA